MAARAIVGTVLCERSWETGYRTAVVLLERTAQPSGIYAGTNPLVNPFNDVDWNRAR